MRGLILCFMLILSVNLGFAKDREIEATDSNIKAFAMVPPLTVLLEILHPQGMIGLNYKPYPEDIDFMPENVAKLPIIGMQRGNEPIFEKLIALKPDVIFFSEDTDKKILDSYQKFGIKAIKVNAFDESKLDDTIRIYGRMLNVESRANELLDFINTTNAKLANLSAKITHRPKIYFAQGVDGLTTQCGKQDDKNDLAYRIGGINALNCDRSFVNVNFEILLDINPDVIFVREIALYKQLIKSPPKQWQSISAIKNKKVYYAPSTPSNWLMKPPSVMQSIGVPFAFAKVHSDILSESEAKANAQAFFAKFLKTLSDKDYKRISGE